MGEEQDLCRCMLFMRNSGKSGRSSGVGSMKRVGAALRFTFGQLLVSSDSLRAEKEGKNVLAEQS